MKLITNILNLIQGKNRPRGLSKEMKDHVANSVASFNNRPIHTTLTAEIIDSASDESLLQIVFDHISKQLPPDYQEEFDAVMSLNKSKQAIYMIWVLEAEVNNGGFNQFYVNSSGQFYPYLPDALKLVGAKQFLDLTKRANQIYEEENEQITKHQDGSIEGFSNSYDDNPLNDLDTIFYELYQTENLQQIQVQYIRKNKEEFTGNDLI